MVKTIYHSIIYCRTHLITILAAAVWQITAQEQTYKSQHEIILADFDRYMVKTLSLVIILTDDAIKYTCILAISVT